MKRKLYVFAYRSEDNPRKNTEYITSSNYENAAVVFEHLIKLNKIKNYEILRVTEFSNKKILIGGVR